MKSEEQISIKIGNCLEKKENLERAGVEEYRYWQAMIDALRWVLEE